MVDGVTLTIEPGTVVNLGSNYIQVNGTLRAEGSENQLIKFSGIGGANIILNNVSSWDEQAETWKHH